MGDWAWLQPAGPPASLGEEEHGGLSLPPHCPADLNAGQVQRQECAIPGSPRHRHLSGACGHRAVTDAAVTVHTFRK